MYLKNRKSQRFLEKEKLQIRGHGSLFDPLTHAGEIIYCSTPRSKNIRQYKSNTSS